MSDAPVMEPTDLRHFLNEAKKKPVHAALGIGSDGAAVMLMHKTISPMILSKQLMLKSQGIKTVRWGTVFVEDQQPKVLVARLNKAASGMARKLAKTVKIGGFTKVVLEFEDGSKEEGSDEEAVAGAAPTDGQPGRPTGEATTPEPGKAAPAAKPVDMNALAAELTALTKRMLPLIAADATRKDKLAGLSKAARAALDSKKADTTKAAIDALKDEIVRLEAPPPPATPTAKGPPQADAAAIDKARKLWLGTRKRVDGDLGKLLAAIKTTYDGHGALADIEKHVQGKLDAVLDALDEDLADKLEELGKAQGGERAKVVQEAKQIIARYQKHVQSDKLLGALDTNPFVPLTVQKSVSDALAALSRSVA